MPVLNRVPGLRLGAQEIAKTYYGGHIKWPPGGVGGGGYRYYRLDITDGGNGGFLSLGEWDLYETVGGADIAAAGTPSAKSQHSAPFGVGMAFDNDQDTRWLTNQALPQWIQVDLGAGNEVTIAEYSLRAYNHLEAPRTWTLQGSNDGSSWVELDAVTTTWSADYQVQTFGV